MSALILLLALPSWAGIPAARAVLCRPGRPAMPVVVSAKATARAKAAARDLAAVLGRVCGSPFSVEIGDGSRGLALGLAADFPAGASVVFDAPEPLRREQYLLRSHAQGLLALGATDAAVEAAAARLLHLAGYRRFMPAASWEVVPREPGLALSVDELQAPSYATRRIWYGSGESADDSEGFAEWRRRNRVPGAFELNTGHAYEAIIARNKEAFAAHPEYRGLVAGKRVSTKFCLSNKRLRELVAADAARRLEARPGLDSVSVEPSDGEGWCECAACAAMGAVSDRVLTLANEVATSLAERRPAAFAAFYAYNEHANAPRLTRAAESVIVSVATSYIPEGATPEGLLAAWRAQGARHFGVRDYFGVFAWHRGLPGRMRGGNLSYLATAIPRFHALGARFYSAEASGDWGANGLGYYAASRILWDVKEAERIDEIREDFLKSCFGAARGPMRDFYALIDGSAGLKKREIPASLPPSLYARLLEAWEAETEPAVRARVADLALYARYVELYAAYESAATARRAVFTELALHARRMKGRGLVYRRDLEAELPKKDKEAVLPPAASDAEYTQGEAEAILRRGAAAR